MTSHNKPASINCLHGGISRLRAEQLLLAAKQDGGFLVRESESIPGAYTLCILFENRVHQYRILPDNEGKLAIQSEVGVVCRKYNDLTQLIQEYMQRGAKNGMAGPLIHPIPPDSPSDDEDSADEEKVEDEADGLQFEVVPHSIETEPGYSPGSVSNADGMQNNINDFFYQCFLQRFRSLNLSRCDGPFINILQSYIDRGANLDAQVVASGGDTLIHLRHVIDEAARDFDKQLENLMVKIDICRQLFGPITTAPLVDVEKEKGQSHKADIASIFERVTRCKSAVQNLEKKAKLKYTDLLAMWKEGGVQIDPPCGTRREVGMLPVKPVIPATSFEAKLVSRGSQSKIKLTVDIQAGKLLAIKPNKECINDRNMFTHDRIEQLILSTSNNCRLDIKVTNLGLKTYVFEDIRQRENFCQLVQQLKNMHSTHPEVKKISFYIGTWNMGDEVPLYSLLQWIKSDGLGKKRNSTLAMIPHDIYVFGTQESVLSDKEWTNRLKIVLMETFGEEFYQVALSTLWGIRLVIFAKIDHKNKISHIQQSTVKTGLGNALGNKGAVGVSFNFSRTSFCFICAHLTSGHEKNKRRNQNFRDILKGLDLVPKKVGPFDITKQFHHLFFFGDLNYRIEELDSKAILNKLKDSNDYSFLLQYDQLRRTQQSKEAFVDFREEEITFPPTYRFKKGTRSHYVWQKFKTTGTRINAPSYCDRILWSSYPETLIFNTSYGCTDQICSSDHKPVFATFDVGVLTQFTSAKGGDALSGDMKIIFEEINAEVKTSRQESFKIEFHSSCLEAPVITKPNTAFEAKKENFCCPKWSSSQLPQLQPIFDDRDYLEDRHLLVSVKTADGLESYGECVLALKSMFAIKPQKFCSPLMHLGEETGLIRGLMHVKAKDNSPSALQNQKSYRIYDLIYTDVEFQQEKNDPSIIYQEMLELGNTSQPPQRKPAERMKSNNTLPMGTLPGSVPPPVSSVPAGGISRSSSILSTPLSDSISMPCLANVPPEGAVVHQTAMHPAKAMVDLTRDDGRTFEDVAKPEAPNLPPRKGRSGLPPSTDSGVTACGATNLAPDPSILYTQVRSGGSMRRYDIVSDPSTGVRSGDRTSTQQKTRSSLAPTNSNPYANFDSSSVKERPPLPLPNERPTARPDLIASSSQSPCSIEEWLDGLRLIQYKNTFLANGWDNLDFITDMTIEDLQQLNIVLAEHQVLILQSIEKLKKRKL